MRIAFLIRSLGTGGAERAAVSLANGMSQQGHDVSVLVLTGDSSFFAIHPSVSIRFLSGKADEMCTSNWRGIVRRVSAIRAFLRRNQPQVLIGMSYTMSAYAALCCIGTKTRSVGTERANPFVYNSTPIHTILRKATAVFCRGFVCQTQKALSFFPGSVQKKAAVIPNGLFNAQIETIPVPAVRRKEITAMGRLDHNKGFDVLLHAFAKLHAIEPEYILTVFGEGKLRNSLSELSESLGVSDHFFLPGNDPDALQHIAQSSVFVLSSRSEGMPNALMEAMAVGVPCVSTRCDMGPEELIRDGENGLLVPVDDPQKLCDAVLRLLQNVSLSASISQKSLKIRQTHSLEKTIHAWLAYFDALLH